ncbi:hypothetical protein [Puia dinghuensis]|uniref:DUF4328 domain-containing protein n=1 Tax=Puia dinghuensis TaxID=1792502 RepID=A0A8J2U7E6_9BACT|nr:hypothetical protein [Puia dinghuensis]GGA83584.1 hypothetical protein GCM10011511_03370 [Puia dinghuensis]
MVKLLTVETYSVGGAGALQIVLLFPFLILGVLFLLTQQNTLKSVKAENRLMHPGLVWLQLIPLFGQLWQFFVVSKIAGSIDKEMRSWHSESIFGADAVVAEGGGKRPTRRMGLAYCILYLSMPLLIILTNLFGDFAPNGIVFLLFMFTLGVLMLGTGVCWIIYWVQLARYKNKLKRGGAAMAG